MDDFLKKWDEAKIGAYDPGHDKLKNDPGFISDFIEYCQRKDRQWFFHGENGYCGYTATVDDDYDPFTYGRFEFAYGEDFVKVFTAHHDGFWVPEYISLSGDEAQPLLDILYRKIIEWGGFKETKNPLEG